jgi:protein AroM
VICPRPDQVLPTRARWEYAAAEVTVECADPHEATTAAVGNAARRLLVRGAEIMLLDCMGFGVRHALAVENVTHGATPVILARTAVAHALAEVLTTRRDLPPPVAALRTAGYAYRLSSN